MRSKTLEASRRTGRLVAELPAALERGVGQATEDVAADALKLEKEQAGPCRSLGAPFFDVFLMVLHGFEAFAGTWRGELKLWGHLEGVASCLERWSLASHGLALARLPWPRRRMRSPLPWARCPRPRWPRTPKGSGRHGRVIRATGGGGVELLEGGARVGTAVRHDEARAPFLVVFLGPTKATGHGSGHTGAGLGGRGRLGGERLLAAFGARAWRMGCPMSAPRLGQSARAPLKTRVMNARASAQEPREPWAMPAGPLKAIRESEENRASEWKEDDEWLQVEA